MKKILLLSLATSFIPSFSSMVFKIENVVSVAQVRCSQYETICSSQPSRLLEHCKIMVLLGAACKLENGLSTLFDNKAHFIDEYSTLEGVRSEVINHKINESLTDFINYNKENNEKLTNFYKEWKFMFDFMGNFKKILEESSDLLPTELRPSFFLACKLITIIDNKIFGRQILKREDMPSLEVFIQKCKECR